MGCTTSVEHPRVRPTGQCLPLNCDFLNLPAPGDDVPLPHFEMFSDHLDGFVASMPREANTATEPSGVVVPKPHPMNKLRMHFLCSTPGTPEAPPCAHTLFLSVTQPLPGKHDLEGAHPEDYEAINAQNIENAEVGEFKEAITRPSADKPGVSLVSFQLNIQGRHDGPLVLWVLESEADEKLKQFNDKRKALVSVGPIVDSDGNPIKYSARNQK